MKHTSKVTTILILLFVLSQVVGLYVVGFFAPVDTLPLNIERPDIDPSTSFITLFVFIIIATVIAVLLLKFRLFRVWKAWFVLSIFVTLAISFSAFIPENIAIVLAGIFALWKVLKPNVLVHNLTEPFVYGSIAAIFVPILTIATASLLLILISVYDYIAVRKTKHMVTLAKSQGEAKVFAGLLVPYGKNVAILGGGDMGFPLLFAGVVMVELGLGFFHWLTFVIPLFATLMLLALFVKGNKKTFYPAMPYISLGCFLGLLIVLLLV